jgi:hypothetical protein
MLLKSPAQVTELKERLAIYEANLQTVQCELGKEREKVYTLLRAKTEKAGIRLNRGGTHSSRVDGLDGLFSFSVDFADANFCESNLHHRPMAPRQLRELSRCGVERRALVTSMGVYEWS